MRSLSIFVALGVVGAVVVACSSSDDTTSSSSSSSSGSSGSSGAVGDLPTQATIDGVAAAVCDRFVACASEGLVKSIWGSTANCKTRQAAQIKLNVGSPGYTVTDTAAQACKKAFEARSCKDALSGIQPKECDFKGTLTDGTACANDQQCASGACVIKSGETCGKCGPRAAAGASCKDGARCDGQFLCSSSGTCAALADENGPCTTNDDCNALLSCVKGKCTAPLAKDVVCVLGENELPCDGLKSLFCIPATATDTAGKCTEVSFAQTGGDCGVTQEPTVKLTICENGDCNDTTKKCEAHLADGASCSTSSGPTCANPAECRNGKCALRDPSVCK